MSRAGRPAQTEALRVGRRRQCLALRPAVPAVRVVDQRQVPQGLLSHKRRRSPAGTAPPRTARRRHPEPPYPQARRAQMGQQQSHEFGMLPQEVGGNHLSRYPGRLRGPLRLERGPGQTGRQGLRARGSARHRVGHVGGRVGHVRGQARPGVVQTGQTAVEVALGQVPGRWDDVRRGARGLGSRPGEQLGQLVTAQTGEELSDGQAVDEGAGGELPVARGGAVGDRTCREESGAQQPPGGPPVEVGLQFQDSAPADAPGGSPRTAGGAGTTSGRGPRRTRSRGAARPEWARRRYAASARWPDRGRAAPGC